MASTPTSTGMPQHSKNQSLVKTTFEIEAPSIDHVQGVKLSVLNDGRKTSPLYIELAAENIAYLRAICMLQIEKGDINRAAKKQQILRTEHSPEEPDEQSSPEMETSPRPPRPSIPSSEFSTRPSITSSEFSTPRPSRTSSELSLESMSESPMVASSNVSSEQSCNKRRGCAAITQYFKRVHT